MPFGKHRGKPLGEVPEAYLLWLLDTLKQDHVDLQDAIRKYLHGSIRPRRPPLLDWEDLHHLVERWVWEMQRRFDPNAGGSVEALRFLEVAHRRLIELLGAPEATSPAAPPEPGWRRWRRT
jgi:hypothetical protein